MAPPPQTYRRKLMSDYWDHPEYGELEKKLEKQVASTRKWMALHDEAVERETALSSEGAIMREAVQKWSDAKHAGINGLIGEADYITHLKAAELELIVALDAVSGKQDG